MTKTSPYSSEQRRARGSTLIRILPFVILLFGAIVLALKWNAIPDRWAVHWGINGQPDRWATKSPLGVFLPVGAGALLCCFLEGLTWMLKASAERRDEISIETASAIAALTADLVRLIEIALAIVFVCIGLALPLFHPFSPAGLVGLLLLLISGAIVFGMIRLRRGVGDLKQAGHSGLEGYNGITYKNPDDPRLWVPKLAGMGYTLNFAHRWGWPILIAMVAVPLGLILVVLVGRFL